MNNTNKVFAFFYIFAIMIFLIMLYVCAVYGMLYVCAVYGQPYLRTQNYDPNIIITSYKIKASADPNTYESEQNLGINTDPNGFIVPAEIDGSLKIDLAGTLKYTSYGIIINAIAENGVYSCPANISFVRTPTPEKPVPYITKESCWFDRWIYVRIEDNNP